MGCTRKTARQRLADAARRLKAGQASAQGAPVDMALVVASLYLASSFYSVDGRVPPRLLDAIAA